MLGEAEPHPTPLRLSATSVTGLVGASPRVHASSVLSELRRQRIPKIHDEPVPEKGRGNRFVDRDVYLTLVGMIRDNYSQTSEQHIEAIKEFLEEEHPHDWYVKLYRCICSSVGSVIHEELSVGEPKEALTLILMPNVLLVGKPDIVEEDLVIELKTRKAFLDTTLEAEKVQVFCYMKLTGKLHSVLRQVVGEETRDTVIEWDEMYWNRIYRTIEIMLEWL
jgi:hypothetical protein